MKCWVVEISNGLLKLVKSFKSVKREKVKSPGSNIRNTFTICCDYDFPLDDWDRFGNGLTFQFVALSSLFWLDLPDSQLIWDHYIYSTIS